jgi:molecular chaperone HtpG
MLKAAGHAPPESKPNLEVNLEHPLLKRLEAEQGEEQFEQLSSLLLEQAMLAEGRPLDDPAAFVRRVNDLLFRAQDTV